MKARHHQPRASLRRVEALADRGVPAHHAGVVAEEHTVPRRLDDERRPQGRVSSHAWTTLASETVPLRVLAFDRQT